MLLAFADYVLQSVSKYTDGGGKLGEGAGRGRAGNPNPVLYLYFIFFEST